MAATKGKGKAKKARNEKGSEGQEKLANKAYEKELARLHGELVKLQLWVVAKGLRVVVVFEGRDGAGKGGVIKAITERVSPRVFRLVALPAPTEREQSQMYVQRYMRHFPAGGEIVIFDRSWYNRAGVERVMEFCSMEQVKRFLEVAPEFEKAIVESGILLIKYWLEVSPEEQTRRLEARINDPRKILKLSPMDLKSYSRWSITRALATTCSRRPTRPGRRGMSFVPTTRGARGSMRSRTSSRRFPMRICRATSQFCPRGRRLTAMLSPTIRLRLCRSWTGARADLPEPRRLPSRSRMAGSQIPAKRVCVLPIDAVAAQRREDDVVGRRSR
jgi:polyphosphate kinase